jgi:hypothetical protein
MLTTNLINRSKRIKENRTRRFLFFKKDTEGIAHLENERNAHKTQS